MRKVITVMYFRMDQLLLLEHLTYLHDVHPLKSILECKGRTVREILDDIDATKLIPDKNYGSFITGRDWNLIFLAMERDPEILEARVIDTHIDRAQGGGGGISIVLISARKQEAVIAFRGTAPAEWADDFMGGNVVSTVQQDNALLWYRSVYEMHALSDYYITVIGHSKGGNKAKFITILDDTPDRCVAFDGQGFSDKFFYAYKDRIIARSPVIENHNIDYDYVNILLNDVGVRHYYQGYNYGRGGLAESHCPNTFFCFAPDGTYTIIKNENGQSIEMQEMDKFLNSYTRSIPTDKEKTESTELLGYLIERAFNLKTSGDSITDYVNFLCEMVSSDKYNDNVAFLFAFYIHYERMHPGFTNNISRVLEYFDMEGFARYIRMVESLLKFPGLNNLIMVAHFFTKHLPDPVFHAMQNYIRDRFDVVLTKEQIKGMLLIIRMLKESLEEIQITDEGLDLDVNDI